MPDYNGAEVERLLSLSRQYAAGYGVSLNTSHLLLSSVGAAEGEFREVLQRYDVSQERVLICHQLSSNVIEGLDHVLLSTRRAVSKDTTANNVASSIHLMLGILAGDCVGRSFLIVRGVDVVALGGELLGMCRIPTLPRPNRPAGERRGGEPQPLQQQIPPNPPMVERPAVRVEIPRVLKDITRNLTQLARDGKLDPVIGRERELERIVRILKRRNKNNPVIIGDAGVGKTAVVEGLAILISQGRVPDKLRDVVLLSLDVSAIVSGTMFRGSFEEKGRAILSALEKSPNIIIFIDEIHLIVGAGSAEGAPMDLGNLLKPALARGAIRCIGATTTDEYSKHIEKDAALERRFQPVRLDPPTVEQTLLILGGKKHFYEEHHVVTISSDAVEAAVVLSDRYITDRNQPDKAIDLLDEACSNKSGSNDPHVTKDDIASIVTEWTGIPVLDTGRLVGLQAWLSQRVIGQDHAVCIVSDTLRKIVDLARPKGSFLFLGPTGVGKTELAKRLAEYLFGSKDALIVLDMSEFSEKHTVSKLIGAPPGYVGYDDAGQLTEPVRRRPYCVVLLDEIEKAHPEIYRTLLQILEEGRLTDAQGRRVNFANTIFILTSNIIPDKASESIGFVTRVGEDKEDSRVRQALLKAGFGPELINRLDAKIVFKVLSRDNLFKICDLRLEEVTKNLRERGYGFEFETAVKDVLVDDGYDPAYGARHLRRSVDNHINIPLGKQLSNFNPGDVIFASVSEGKIVFSRRAGA